MNVSTEGLNGAAQAALSALIESGNHVTVIETSAGIKEVGLKDGWVVNEYTGEILLTIRFAKRAEKGMR